MSRLVIPSVPPRYAACTFENFNPRTVRQREAVQALRDAVIVNWLPEANALLCGPPGVGKTHLGCAALRAQAECDAEHDDEFLARRDALFVSWVRLCAMLADKDAEADALLRHARRAKLLMLDDLSPPETAAEGRALLGLVHARHDAGMGTIVTTNAARVELPQLFGARVAERMAEGALLLSLDGKSHRQPRAESAAEAVRKLREFMDDDDDGDA